VPTIGRTPPAWNRPTAGRRRRPRAARYLAAAQDHGPKEPLPLRLPDRHSPNIGLLLCAGRKDNIVRYSLAGATAPLASADHTYDSLPAEVRELVPTDEQLDTDWPERRRCIRDQT
jgi:hypothetical protein